MTLYYDLPKAPPISAPLVGMFTLTRPQSDPNGLQNQIKITGLIEANQPTWGKTFSGDNGSGNSQSLPSPTQLPKKFCKIVTMSTDGVVKCPTHLGILKYLIHLLHFVDVSTA